MSAVRPALKTRAKTHRRLMATVACAVLYAGLLPALAQETSSLRGAVSEDETNSSLLGGKSLSERPTRLTGTPDHEKKDPRDVFPAGYNAISTEPVESQPGQSLFEDENDREDAFGEVAEPAGPRRPSTAAGRAKAANDDAMAGPEAMADRVRRTGASDGEVEAATRVDTIDSENDLTVDGGAERVEPIEGIDPDPDEDPFAPVGLRAGTFILRPSLESGISYTTNVDSSPDPEPSTLSETTLRLNAVSDWSSHSAYLNAYGNFRTSVDGAEFRDTQAGADGQLQLDLGNDYQATAAFRYERRRESASSPVDIVGAVSRPLRQTLDGSLGLSKEFGKARFGVTGKVERDWYGNAELASGGLLSQEERNSTLSTIALRGGYEISPAITPFAELEIGRRIMDIEIDASDYQRSTSRLAARGGLDLDLGEKLGGEVTAGWVREEFDDNRLAAISGAELAADLRWSPLRGTTVNLTGSTSVDGTTTAGESGSLLYATRLSVDHKILSNVTGTAAVGLNYRDYVGIDGHDLTWSAELGATWWLNRYAGISTRAKHEELTSSLPGRDSSTDSVFLGLKLQR